MSERKYFCKYCDIYIADDAPSRQRHENGLRHKGNVEKKDLEEEEEETRRVLEQAVNAYFAQVAVAGLAAMSSPASSSNAPKKPLAKPCAFTIFNTAQSPDAKRIAAQLELRQSQGVAGSSSTPFSKWAKPQWSAPLPDTKLEERGKIFGPTEEPTDVTEDTFSAGLGPELKVEPGVKTDDHQSPMQLDTSKALTGSLSASERKQQLEAARAERLRMEEEARLREERELLEIAELERREEEERLAEEARKAEEDRLVEVARKAEEEKQKAEKQKQKAEEEKRKAEEEKRKAEEAWAAWMPVEEEQIEAEEEAEISEKGGEVEECAAIKFVRAAKAGSSKSVDNGACWNCMSRELECVRPSARRSCTWCASAKKRCAMTEEGLRNRRRIEKEESGKKRKRKEQEDEETEMETERKRRRTRAGGETEELEWRKWMERKMRALEEKMEDGFTEMENGFKKVMRKLQELEVMFETDKSNNEGGDVDAVGDAESLPPPIDVQGKPEYEISKILDSKIDCHWHQSCKLLYLVRWLGYENTDEEFSWLSATRLEHAKDLISDFHSAYPNKPGPLSNL